MAVQEMSQSIARAAQIVRDADAIIIAAGAGMGVDSGLPDFRGKSGFWKAYPALADAGINFQAAASAASFVRAPTRAWGFYGHRLALYRRPSRTRALRCCRSGPERRCMAPACSPVMLMVSSRPPASIRCGCMNATVRSITCNAACHAARRSGAPMGSTQ